MGKNQDPGSTLFESVYIRSIVGRPGDLVISDNLAVGHEASPDTQLPRQPVLGIQSRIHYSGSFSFLIKVLSGLK
jgi:hypothetical protein